MAASFHHENQLQNAITSKNLEKLERLLASEARRALVNRPAAFWGKAGALGYAMWCWRPRGPHIETVRLLLRHGADVNLRGQDGRTVLHHTVYDDDNDMIDVIRVLLQEGRADPNMRDRDGQTPLQVACHRNKVGVAKMLVEHGADRSVVDENGFTVLDASTGLGMAPELLCLLLEKGGNANHRSQIGQPLLHLAAASWANERAVKVLLDFGADPKSRDQHGKNALEVACRKGRLGCIFLLFQRMITDGSISFNLKHEERMRYHKLEIRK